MTFKTLSREELHDLYDPEYHQRNYSSVGKLFDKTHDVLVQHTKAMLDHPSTKFSKEAMTPLANHSKGYIAQAVNTVLRNPEYDLHQHSRHAGLEHHDNMQSMIFANPKINITMPHELHTYRGLTAYDKALKSLAPGTTVALKGYTSSSQYPHVTTAFVNSEAVSKGGLEQHFARFVHPKGSSSSIFSLDSYHPAEREFVTNHDAKAVYQGPTFHFQYRTPGGAPFSRIVHDFHMIAPDRIKTSGNQ